MWILKNQTFVTITYKILKTEWKKVNTTSEYYGKLNEIRKKKEGSMGEPSKYSIDFLPILYLDENKSSPYHTIAEKFLEK